MEELTANILFSGIGAQERGFMDSGLFKLDVLCTSDIDKDATLSYAAIYCGLGPELLGDYRFPGRQEMADHLKSINLGYDPKKNKEYDWDKLARRKSNDLEKYYLAAILSKNKGDISRIERLPKADFWTVSFPCTNISVAGRMKGLKPDSGTQSSLLWENIRLLKRAKEDGKLPKYLLFENVKNLVGKKFKGDFNNLLEVLDELGYNTYWKIINGKNCGIPQNRERVFAICIRKDIDRHTYTFPKPFDTGIRLKDLLDNEVDEKYYINNSRADELIINLLERENILETSPCELCLKEPKLLYIANCLTAKDRGIANRGSTGTGVIDVKKSNKVMQVGGLTLSDKRKNPSANRVYLAKGISPTLVTSSGGGHEPKVIVSDKKILQKGRGFNKGGIYDICPAITSNSFQENNFVVDNQMVACRGRYKETKSKLHVEQQLELRKEPTANALTTVQKDSLILENKVYVEGKLNHSQDGKVVDPRGLSLTHTAGNSNSPKIVEGKELEDVAIDDLHEFKGVRVYYNCAPDNEIKQNSLQVICYQYRIRKLTPRECFRLMGFTDTDVDRVYAMGLSDSALYKQTGNSIITNCVELLAEHLYKAQYEPDFICADKHILENQDNAQLSFDL